MHADGYAGFNELYRGGVIREVACMAHIRRKFIDVFQSEGSVIAEEAKDWSLELHRAFQRSLDGAGGYP